MAADRKAGECVSARWGGIPTGMLLIVWAIAFLGLRLLAPLAQAMPAALAASSVVTLFMFLSLSGPRIAVGVSLSFSRRAALFVLFAALSLIAAGTQAKTGAPSGEALLAGISDLLLIASAALLGQMLAGLFREPGLLVPAALVAALVDYWGVYYGTTRAVLERHAEVASKLSVQIPVPMPGGPAAQIGIGFGDFVFFTLFLASARRFALRERLTFWMSFAALLAVMETVALHGLSLPALAPMSGVFLVANWGKFRFQRGEVAAMVYAGLIIAVLIGIVAVIAHHGS